MRFKDWWQEHGSIDYDEMVIAQKAWEAALNQNRNEYDLSDIAGEIDRLSPHIKDAKELADNKILSESAKDLLGVYCEFFEYVKSRECFQGR